MFASVVQTAMLSCARASGLIRADDEDIGSSLWSALPTLIVCLGVLWLLVRLFAPEGHLQPRNAAKKTKRQKIHVLSVSSAHRPRPRVIDLHAVTPGQSRHDYNVGDSSGTQSSRSQKLRG